MRRTLFAGLLVLEPGESLGEDDGAFTDSDREVIDHFLEIGAKTHRHTGVAGLSNPSAQASAGVVASGGTLAADLSIGVGYTLEDANGGETMLSPVATVSTQGAVESPLAAPSAVASYSSGNLGVGTYYYATTFTDGEGGETEPGPAVVCERAPGYASGEITLSALTFGVAAAGAKGWRLYRAIGGGSYDLLAAGGADTDSFIDDGSAPINCEIHPPSLGENTTKGVSTLLVSLPSGVQSGTQFINIYASVTGDFSGGSFLERYPVSSAGRLVAFTSLPITSTSPPKVNRSIGGADQIDPDTELLDWHWKRPVTSSASLGSGTLGDVRLVTSTGTLWGVLTASASAAPGWARIASAGGGAAAVTASASAVKVPAANEIDLFGSGNVQVSLSEPSTGRALFKITGTASAGPPGATGAKGATGAPGAAGKSNGFIYQFVGTPGVSFGQAKLTETELLLDEFCNEPGSQSLEIAEVLRKWTSGYILIQEIEGTNFALKRVTGTPTVSGGAVKIPVSTVGIGGGGGLVGNCLVSHVSTGPSSWGLVTELPAAPKKGDTCYFYADKTNGIIWHLLYDGEGVFPWKKIGGAPLAFVATEARETSSTANQTAGAPSTTALLNMEARFTYGAKLIANRAAALNEGQVRILLNGVAPDAVQYVATQNGQAATAYKTKPFTVEKGKAIAIDYHVAFATPMQFFELFFEIDPIRVG